MKKLIFLVIIASFLISCGSPKNGDSTATVEVINDQDSTADTNTDTTSDIDTPDVSPDVITYNVNGYIQKGAFISGSTIKIQELDSDFEPTGTIYETTTNDDLGSFSIGSEIKEKDIEIIACGYYFNEVTGQLSNSEICLRSIIDLTSGGTANVNLLTTLSKERIKYLVLSESKDFAVAKKQTEIEILAIFSITDLVDATFDTMDISIDDEKGGALLSISSILQFGNSEAQLSEMISKINLDIKNDGILNDAVIIAEIKLNSESLDLDQIELNVETRYGNLGQTISIGKFKKYVDSDNDGLLNGVDDDVIDPISFASVINVPLGAYIFSNEETISGLSINSKSKAFISGTGDIYLDNVVQTADFKIENGNKIKFGLQVGEVYNVVKTGKILTINGVDHTYSGKTEIDNRQQIIVFDSGQSAMQGNFGAVNAQNWCNAGAIVNDLTGDISPWLSIAGNLKDIIIEDQTNPRKVTSLLGGLVATKWGNAFIYENTDTFENLNIVDTDYWTGSVGGNRTNNCSDWTSWGNNVSAPGDYGNYNKYDFAARTTDGNPQGINTTQCDQVKKLLCIAH